MGGPPPPGGFGMGGGNVGIPPPGGSDALSRGMASLSLGGGPPGGVPPPGGGVPPPGHSHGGGYAGGYGAPPGYGGGSAGHSRGSSKKSVLIGINYLGSRRPLSGCINDVKNVKKFLTEKYGYPSDAAHMKVLTDDSRNSSSKPTKRNMISAMRWLVRGARPGDQMFLHFSGHGGQTRDLDGDEDDGLDETILPCDYSTSGQITDDELHDILVKPLPAGAKLTVLFDSCHSGTALDLPYVYNERGCVEWPGMATPSVRIQKKMKKAKKKKKKDKKGHKGHGGYRAAAGHSSATQTTIATKTTPADVVMFAGCKDSQTSMDTHFAGFGRTGAMSYAFITSLTSHPSMSYRQLLVAMRDTLNRGTRRFAQIPQLSSGHQMDLNQPFYI